ncbi:MAG TPA: hypothetical protein VFX65_10775 [Candidatus Limnocylindrales bacterium]|nr:hypothetical protein [Candidatus Limnocylindrales bacterium]
MTMTLKRLRPLLIGLVVLLFTAGIAFAGKPSAPAPGLSVAAEASGKTVPVQAEEEDEEEEVDEEEEEEEEEEESEEEVESEEAGENCATDPTTLTEEELAELRHGSIVCWAAHQETPDGYANHGEWVSEWAKQNRGHEDEAEDEDAETTEAAAASAGRGNGKAKGKANKP